MIYDFYRNFQIENKNDVNDITNGSGKYEEIQDVASKVMLLISAYKIKDLKDYAKVGEKNSPRGLKALIHSRGDYNNYLQYKLSELDSLYINTPIELSILPKGSWILQLPITLAKPFISKDDIPFYIIENPVRKDKVFGVPFISAMTWKGSLRWVMMKVFLEPIINNAEKFAKVRFLHTLLFGTEKGWGEAKSWTNYIDNLCPRAKEQYGKLLKEKFRKENVKDINVQGTLRFYPTFWDKIDMIVINPHDRLTKTGKNPIYFEVVPVGAKGIFKLAYIPLYWLGLSENKLKEKVMKDLKGVITGLREMMINYGFSAKKTSGFGMIQDKWNRDESKLEVKGFYKVRRFGNFEELEKIVKKLGDENE